MRKEVFFAPTVKKVEANLLLILHFYLKVMSSWGKIFQIVKQKSKIEIIFFIEKICFLKITLNLDIPL